ncbi:MAG: TerB family tellurite resistance protein [Pseudomonadales bacterium]
MLSKLLNRLKAPEQEPEGGNLLALAAAALLLEVAWADHDIAADELSVIERQLKQQFALTSREVAELVEESRKVQETSVGVYGYTRTINEQWSEAQKFDLVTALWRLALADSGLDRYEEHTIRKIAELLYLSHSRFIEAKLKARRET